MTGQSIARTVGHQRHDQAYERVDIPQVEDLRWAMGIPTWPGEPDVHRPPTLDRGAVGASEGRADLERYTAGASHPDDPIPLGARHQAGIVDATQDRAAA
jgi:hypothetical protein